MSGVYKSNMVLAVEFLPGTTISEAVREARGKCRDYNLAYVTFKFNGVSFSISQSGQRVLPHNWAEMECVIL